MSDAEKKPGFWSRLFGVPASSEPQPATPAHTSPPAAPAPDVPSPAPGFVIPPSETAPGAIDRTDAGASQPAEAAPPATPEPPQAPAESPAPVASVDRPDAGAAPEPKTWWSRLTSGMRRTSDQLTEGVTAIFTRRRLDEATLDELEDVLLQADLGADTAARVTDALRSGRYDKELGEEGVRRVLAEEVAKVLKPVARPLDLDSGRKPHVVLVVGVNGTGKTTTIGKLASILRGRRKTVVLAAGDTFRAAAIEQLRIWGERTGASVVAKEAGADAAGLAFEALEKAKADNADVLIIDTAGRLQNKAGLMAELEKIVRVIRKLDPSAPHTVIQTLDATTGQNAVNQVEIFGKVAGVTGLVMTKLDGTARGGILVAVAAKFGLPVHFIGVGEGIDDLEPFDADEFARVVAGLA